MDKKRLACGLLLSISLLGCGRYNRGIQATQSIILEMQNAKRHNDCWRYARFFDFTCVEVVHYPDRILRQKLTDAYARRGIYDWKSAFCGTSQTTDITKYRPDQSVLFCLPAYEDIKKFTFKKKDKRTIVCSYIVKTMGMDAWVEYDVFMTFIRGPDGDWTIGCVERGPERKSKDGKFN